MEFLGISAFAIRLQFRVHGAGSNIEVACSSILCYGLRAFCVLVRFSR